jgi:hypothetical protein
LSELLHESDHHERADHTGHATAEECQIPAVLFVGFLLRGDRRGVGGKSTPPCASTGRSDGGGHECDHDDRGEGEQDSVHEMTP